MTRVGVAAAGAAVALLAVSYVGSRATTSDSPAVAAAASVDGAELFQRKGCATCHTGPDSRARIEVAPSLADAPSWAAGREPGVTAVDYLAESMLAPATFVSPAFEGGSGPMTAMPDLGLSAAEVDALIDYLLRP